MKKFIFPTLITFYLATLIPSLTACSDDSADTTLPVIVLHEPEDGEALKIGNAIHFECDFSDDVMLGSYKIEIHSNTDGHSHKAAATRGAGEVPFTGMWSYDLSGLRNAPVHHHDIIIPENAAEGRYHLMVYCTDAAGNQALVARNVVLSHDAEEHRHD